MKNLSRSTPEPEPRWHPNFRNYESLPDVKVIRTGFAINVVSVTVAAALVLFFAYREIRMADLRGQIAQTVERIENDRASNRELLAMTATFRDQQRRFVEAEKLLAGRVSVAELMTALSGSLPNAMEFSAVTLDEGALTLRGVVGGSPDAAYATVAAYLASLGENAFLRPRYPEVALTSFIRDPMTQRFNYVIRLRPPPPPPAPAGRPAQQEPEA
jgi:hypothetical protein